MVTNCVIDLARCFCDSYIWLCDKILFVLILSLSDLKVLRWLVFKVKISREFACLIFFDKGYQ